MSGPAPTSDFFISYTGMDVKWARWIAQQLEAAGYTTIYQERDFHAGGNFIVQMHRAMQSTRRTIAVLTPEYLRSRYTLPEWAEALRRDPTGEYALLVPVRVKPCDLEGLLGARVYVDLVGLSGEVARQRLVERVKSEDSKPPPPEPFPGEEEAAPVQPSVIAPTGLPLAVSLIGREKMLADLLDNLRKGTTMGVFALEGMGGVGKSALAAEAVAQLSQDQAAFPGGAAWIACEGLEGEAGLAELWTRVATALQLERVKALTDSQVRRAALAQALVQGKRRLLALDNIEPGLDAEAMLETLAVRGHTALLQTARHKVAPLKLRAIELAPLPQPDAETLLVERLQQVDATRPTAAEAPAIPALLAALGGLPLALEVTAAYASIQRRTVQQVADEVKADGLSAAALRADPKRAPLVRFERSWQVLSARQQRLFVGLALQVGVSFPREAALAVAKAAAVSPAPEGAASDQAGGLGALVSYTLLEAVPGGERLRLHPLLREFAEHKLGTLPQAEREQLGDALVAHWRSYAEAHPDFEGMAALEAEAEGLMGALAWAHEHKRHQEVLGLARAIPRAWDVRGRREEELKMYAWTEQAAEALGDLKEQRWSAHQLGVTYSQTGRLSEARAGYERALALERQLGDPAAERGEVHGLAVLDAQTGRLSEARAGYERALALAQQLSDPGAEAAELRNLGVFIGQLGEPEQGRKMIAEALAISERLSDTYNTGKAYQFLAWLDEGEGNRVGALAHSREALRCFEQSQSPHAEDVRAHLHQLEG